MTEKRIRILIADDHPIVRAGFKQVLSDTPDLVVADEAGNGQEVLQYLKKKKYDVVLLDISMPGKSGLEILKELKRTIPNFPFSFSVFIPKSNTPSGH
jgi:DNA-binding NarL/FixJ family response regulator